MEINDNEDLSDTSVNSNGNVCRMNYNSAVDDERNEPHSSIIERENESTSSQFLSPLQNFSASCELLLSFCFNSQCAFVKNQGTVNTNPFLFFDCSSVIQW